MFILLTHFRSDWTARSVTLLPDRLKKQVQKRPLRAATSTLKSRSGRALVSGSQWLDKRTPRCARVGQPLPPARLLPDSVVPVQRSHRSVPERAAWKRVPDTPNRRGYRVRPCCPRGCLAWGPSALARVASPSPPAPHRRNPPTSGAPNPPRPWKLLMRAVELRSRLHSYAQVLHPSGLRSRADHARGIPARSDSVWVVGSV